MTSNSKNWFKIEAVKNIPEVKLPEGYSVRQGKINQNGELCGSDKKAWTNLQRSWKTKGIIQRSVPPIDAKGVFFAEFNGEIVGCVCVIITSNSKYGLKYTQGGDEAGLHHAVVLKEHRRKGLYKAMLNLCLKYCINKKVEMIYATPNDFLKDYWPRVGFIWEKR